MAAIDDVALVVELACMTNDRAPDEQRALLRVALRTDIERSRFTITNPNPIEPFLTDLAIGTYAVSTGRRVTLTAQQRKQYEAMAGRWVRCENCGLPDGAHYEKGRCPT